MSNAYKHAWLSYYSSIREYSKHVQSKPSVHNAIQNTLKEYLQVALLTEEEDKVACKVPLITLRKSNLKVRKLGGGG